MPKGSALEYEQAQGESQCRSLKNQQNHVFTVPKYSIIFRKAALEQLWPLHHPEPVFLFLLFGLFCCWVA